MKTIPGYLTETPAPSVAHIGDWQAGRFYEDGRAPWMPCSAPGERDDDRFSLHKTAREWYSCQYCGSMHPQELAAAIRLGATAHWADFKYGWPHKVYVEKAPNRYEGELEQRGGFATCDRPAQQEIDSGKWIRYQTGFSSQTGEPTYSYHEAMPPEQPAGQFAHGKFYSTHLQDATPEDREIIERAMGKSFEFKDGGVRWWPFAEVKPSEA
jgi:hypothetical protein